MENRDKKGSESLVANHLSCLEPRNSNDDTPIEDRFLDEYLWEVKDVEVSWYANYVSFIISIIVLSDLTFQQKKKFFAKSKYCYREDPLLFRCCADGIMRRCVSEEKMRSILEYYHSSPYGGHHGSNKTTVKILQSKF